MGCPTMDFWLLPSGLGCGGGVHQCRYTTSDFLTQLKPNRFDGGGIVFL